jgi:hypothetical protein
MPDYSKGKIYTIRCKTNNEYVYVGSTCKTLSQRIAGHRHHSKHFLLKCFILRLKIGTIGNIELHEDYPCERKEQLAKREGKITRQIGTLNQIVAGRSIEEWKNEGGGEKRQIYHKSYREINKEKLSDDKKQYYINNKDERVEYFKLNNYRKEHKNEIHKQKREEIICNCGCKTSRGHLARHMKTEKHLKMMENLKIN